jgi:hypothetical protein
MEKNSPERNKENETNAVILPGGGICAMLV